MREVCQISCQLSFYPLGEQEYLPYIDRVIGLIGQSGIAAEVGVMSTVLRGDTESVFALLRQIAETLHGEGCHFAMSILTSDTCGY